MRCVYCVRCVVRYANRIARHIWPKKKAAGQSPDGFQLQRANAGLTLGELFGATCFAQTNLFTFNFACVTSDEAGFR